MKGNGECNRNLPRRYATSFMSSEIKICLSLPRQRNAPSFPPPSVSRHWIPAERGERTGERNPRANFTRARVFGIYAA